VTTLVERRSALLVLRALGLGDLLTAVPAIRALADRSIGERIVLAAPSALRPIVAMIGGVDELIDVTPFDPAPIADTRPAVAVNLHGRGPESHRMLLASRPDRLIAFAHPEVPASHAGPRWDDAEHEVDRWCRLLREHGIAADRSRLAIDPPSGSRDHRTTVLHPGAASAARRWPADRWAAIARAEAAPGRRVVLTGNPAERPLAAAIVEAAGLPATSLAAGATDLRELATLIGGAGLLVSGDTGVAHLAVALDTPSVTLFGPTSPSRWGPPPDRPDHVALWAGTTGDPHASTADRGLLEISVEDVLRGIALARSASDREGAVA
jgi:ADP-heptose:LPS heptosyltransferase